MTGTPSVSLSWSTIFDKNSVDHLTNVLKQDYEFDTNWEGTRYLGLTLNWDFKKRKVHLSMPGYIKMPS